MITCDWCKKDILINQKIEEIKEKDFKMHVNCAEDYYYMKMQED